MKRFPILPLVVLAGLLAMLRVVSAWQAEAPATADSPQESTQENSAQQVEADPKAQELIQQAKYRLRDDKPTVQAEMTQTVSLGEFRFRTQGRYFSAPRFRFRLEYELELGDLKGRFLEVSDGQILHTRREIAPVKASLLTLPEMDLTRRDILEILNQATARREDPEAVRIAELGIGGLPSVLASLERTMLFDAVRPETVDGREYLVVQGRWIPERQQAALAGLGGLAGQIAAFMPDLVRVYLEKETLFPEKFLYLKQASEERKTYRPMLAIEFHNIVLNEPLPPQTFDYVAPPGQEERNETERFLQMLAAGDAPAEPPVE